MKKLVVLLLMCLLALCTAAQAEPTVIDLSECVPSDGTIRIKTNEKIVLTGETEYPVQITFTASTAGEITLRNVKIGNNLQISSSIYYNDRVVVNLEGENTLGVSSSLSGTQAFDSQYPLIFRGNGSLDASAYWGIRVRGNMVVEGGDIRIRASGSYAIWTINGWLSVTGGRLEAEATAESVAAYLSQFYIYYSYDLTVAEGYVIHAGDSSETAVETNDYNGERYLKVSNPDYVFPDDDNSGSDLPGAEMPETGDGANLVLWTLMLAASVIGVLSMRRKAY